MTILPEVGKVYVNNVGEKFKVLAIGRFTKLKPLVVAYQSVEYPCVAHTWVCPLAGWWESFKVWDEWTDI